MKLKLLKNKQFGSRTYQCGWTCEVTDAEGAAMLAAGEGERVADDVRPKKTPLVTTDCVIPTAFDGEDMGIKTNTKTNTKK